MSDTSTIKNRSEIIFIYDVKYANPNGDPLDENKPRIDEETGINYVTDVRLKRTIRDYLMDYLDEKIFIKQWIKENGKLKSKADILKDEDIKTQDDLLRYIDIRLFGSTTAVEKSTIVYTGPVQFNFGRSLHKVKIEYVKGTTIMSSQKKSGDSEKGQGTMTDMYVLPYSLIGFYGMINENTAKDTLLTEQDVQNMFKAMWYGTASLNTRSKIGHTPRVLLQIVYNQDNQGFYIGDLLSTLKLDTDIQDEKIRDPKDFVLNIQDLKQEIQKHQDKIQQINYKLDDRLNLSEDIKNIHNNVQSFKF